MLDKQLSRYWPPVESHGAYRGSSVYDARELKLTFEVQQDTLSSTQSCLWNAYVTIVEHNYESEARREVMRSTKCSNGEDFRGTDMH